MKSTNVSTLCSIVGLVLLCSSTILGQNNFQNLTTRDRNSSQLQASYATLPMTFEANVGQTDQEAKFIARGPKYTVFLTSGEMVLSLRTLSNTPNARADRPMNASGGVQARMPPPNPAVLKITLIGANHKPMIAGEGLQEGKVNYFIGNNPKKWRTNVPIYKQVRYKNMYPGIDLVYYGNQSLIEHDFVIAPGADPRKIGFDIHGVDALQLASNGDLILEEPNGEVRLHAPVMYQESHGMRLPVNGSYSIGNSNRVSFTIGIYDKSLPLIIDPVLEYGTFLGGSVYDVASGIVVDQAGDAYVAGCTSSTDFPGATPGPVPSSLNAFIAKLNATGSSIVYADYLGGSSVDCANGLVIDANNDVFVTGSTYSTDFPTVHAYQATNNSNAAAAFVSEISPDGSSLVYSTYLSGSSYTQGNSIGLDSVGDIYVAGWTRSTDFPTANAYEATASPNQGGSYGQYGFLTEFAAGGATLVYSTYYAGSMTVPQCGGTCWSTPYSLISGMAVDGSGNAYITGDTNTFDFPTTQGSYQPTNTSTGVVEVAFVGKFNSSGTLIYSSYYGATTTDSNGTGTTGIAVDSVGSAYIVGATYGGNPLPATSANLCDPSQTSCDYGFISKFDPTGGTVAYSTYLGPSSVDIEPMALAVDVDGNAYVYSQSAGGSADLVSPIENYTSGEDVFIQEIDPSGGTLLFSTFIGGSADDYPVHGGIAVDSAKNIYISGYTDSADYPVTFGAVQPTLAGSDNGFISKISTTSAPAVSLSPLSVQFPLVAVGSASGPSTVLLRNMGSTPLTISSIVVAGDFSETDSCGSAVVAAGTCSFTVTFVPTQAGTRLGSITIVDSATGSPHVVSLSGQSAAIVASLRPSTLTFSGLQVTLTSSAETVTLTNSGNANLSIVNAKITGPYGQTNNCPESLSGGSSCQFQITFSPQAAGSQYGTLSITDNAADSPQVVMLSGTGIDFSMPANGGSNTIHAGATASYQFSISPIGGLFSNSIALSCSGLPNLASCSVNPSSVTLGGNFATVTVAIKTTGNSAQLKTSEGRTSLWYVASTLEVGAFGMFLLGATERRRRARRTAFVLALVAGMTLWTSCAGTVVSPASHSTPPGSYSIQVIGSSGSLRHSTTLSLTVE